MDEAAAPPVGGSPTLLPNFEASPGIKVGSGEVSVSKLDLAPPLRPEPSQEAVHQPDTAEKESRLDQEAGERLDEVDPVQRLESRDDEAAGIGLEGRSHRHDR